MFKDAVRAASLHACCGRRGILIACKHLMFLFSQVIGSFCRVLLGDSQVLKFVSEACATCAQTEPLCRELNELQLLWLVLQLMCQHKGDLHSALTPGLIDTRPGESQCSCPLSKLWS